MNTIEPEVIGLSEYNDNGSDYSSYEVDEPPIFMFSSFSNIKDSEIKHNIKSILDDDKYRPSTYLQDRSLSLKDKLLQLSYINTVTSSRKKQKIGERYIPQKIKIIDLVHDPDVVNHTYDVPVDTPIFQPYPSQIIIQNFTPFEKYNIVISFRNNDKFARKMKILPIEYPYFTIRGMNSASLNSEKIAPGMEVQYIITFIPEENIDYKYNLVCITEREKFLVPIIAIGGRAILDFPDIVNFSECPVNYESSKMLLVRNIGNQKATFKLTVKEPFSVVPDNGYLDVGESMQVEVKFEPEKVGSYEGEILLEYDTGEEVYIKIYGSADDVNIRLEKQILQMDNTYINLVSMKVLTLYNRSDIIIKYQWKQFSNQIEEKQFRERKIMELNQLREEEELYIKESESNVEIANEKIALMNEKYKNLIKEKKNDEFLFNSKCISITPQEGTIWPNSSTEFRILFQPEKPIEYKRTIYCCVNGRETRLPLQIKGNGIGPKARFSYDQLEIEDVFINTIHKFQAYLENKGDIDVKYKLLPKNTLFGPKFSFSPDIGIIRAGNKQPIDIIFNPDILGDFYEEFLWDIEGSSNAISLIITGKVIGPTFSFEPDVLNFGKSVYGFLNTRTIKLVNTSDIMISYHLRLVSNNPEDANEFTVLPEIGTVLPTSEREIKVTFTPNKIGTYEASIMVDIEHIGNDVLEYHILAESIVPDIELNTVALDYEKCYQGYPYTRSIELFNPSPYPARYRLVSQEETAKIVYSYESSNECGIINPNSKANIDLTVVVKKLGTVIFPVFIEIIGKKDISLVVDITAYGIGPTISLSREEINWGKIKVLEKNSMILEINNNSPIPAKFDCSIVNGNSIYTLSTNADIIQPYSKYPLTVTAFLDDSVKFIDTLKINVESDSIHDIKLISQGVGTTIIFPEDFKTINFGDVFSNRKCSKTFIIKNSGRRTHTLHWVFKTPPQPKNKPKEDIQSIFTVIPQRVVLASGESCELTIEGFSTESKFYNENYVCQGVIDKNPTRFDLIESTVLVNFINPLISIKPSSLDFESIHKEENEYKIEEKILELSNDSSLTLHTRFIYEKPFDLVLESNPLELKPGISIPIKVKFDSSYFKSRVSESKNCKLTLEYLEHPQVDTIDLNYSVLFPNLSIDIEECKFECIPQNTSIRKSFNIFNKGKLPVYYTWNFFEIPDDTDENTENTETNLVPIYQLFDIIPIRGYLEPGVCEKSEIIFHGICSGFYKILAVCDVVGGPKYKLNLFGETSLVSYKFDREVVDFGVQYYQNIVKQDITLFNIGKVEFDYSVILKKDSILEKRISIYPSFGSILPYQKQKITIRFTTLTPENIEEFFFIRIAHFDPIPITVLGQGIAPHIMINLPRITDNSAKITDESETLKENKSKKNNSKEDLNGNEYYEEDENYNSESGFSPKELIEKIKEIERNLLTNKTMEYFDKLYSDNKFKNQSSSKSNYVGSSILMNKVVNKKKGNSSSSNESNYLSELSKIQSTEYICDFGYIIRNTTKTKKIIITNIGQKKVSFAFNVSKLKNTGLSVEPEKIKELPPEESFECYLTFQSRDIPSSEKEINIVLPIEITDGPIILINMKASLTIPEIKIKEDELDFGEVICGQRKTIAIQLFNENVISAEWKIISKNPKKKDFSKSNVNINSKNDKSVEELNNIYNIHPTSGTIHPGKNQLIFLKFEPIEEVNYNRNIILKTTMNSKIITLHLNGVGVKNKLEFQPEEICFDPVLPYADMVEKRFSIYNPNEYPIEVYSRDFDTIFNDEKKLLERIENYENNVIYLPPREIGQPITESYLESSNIKLRPLTHEDEGNKDTPVSTPEDGVGEIEIIPRNKSLHEVSENSPIIFIVYGTPFSGKTTVSKSIAKRYNFLYININEIAENYISMHTFMNESKATINSIQISESSIPLSNTNINNSNMIQEESRTGSTMDVHDNHTNRISIPDDKLIDIIKTRLLREDCRNGVVMDGIDSKYASNATVILKGIMKACPNKNKRVFLNLITDLTNIHLREAQMKQKNNKTNTLTEIKIISEEEYDKLSPEEQKRYDIILKNYKKQKKLIREQAKLEKKKQAELEQQKLEKKADDEKIKKRERNKSFLIPKNSSKESSDKGKDIKEPISETKSVFQSFLKSFITLKSIIDGRRSVSPQLNKKKDEKEKDKDREKESNKEKEKDKDKEKDKEKNEKEKLEKALEHEALSNIDISNSTIKKCELYTSTMELIMGVLKEGEKFNHNSNNSNNYGSNNNNTSYGNSKQNQNPGFNEKRNSQQRNKIDLVASQSTESSNDNESKDEYLFGYYFEINSNVSKDEAFEAIINNIPSSLDPEKLKSELLAKELIPKIEQVVCYPESIPEVKEGKYNFYLINPLQDEDNSQTSIPEVTAPPAVTKPETTSKKGKLTQKQAAEEQKKEEKNEEETEKELSQKYRWIIKPGKKKDLIVKFNSKIIGKFTRNLSFGIVGSNCKYKIDCIGQCQYSQIETDYTKLFQKYRKTKDDQGLSHCEYIVSTSTFEFGPLLYNKPKDKNIDRYIDNKTSLNIINPSNLISLTVDFCFKNDTKSEIFVVDPPTINVEPGETKQVYISAFPKSLGPFEDELIISIKDNPEPLCYKFSCIGVKPELELDKKVLTFDKIHIMKTESRQLILKNISQISAYWKLSGVEQLGDEIKISPVEGIIEYGKECVINAEFHGSKITTIKRSIKLEVSDVERINTGIQTENILVTAEAYEALIDFHPKNSDAVIDFGILGVQEEGKQQYTLKNKGKYEAGFNFSIKDKELSECLTFVPNNFVLQPNDKPFNVQILFKSKKEISFRDNKNNNTVEFQVYDPTDGDITSRSTVKVLAKAVYSKFNIYPAKDLNFGASIFGTKGTKQFTIENNGEFDFRFNIYSLLNNNDSKQGNKKNNTSGNITASTNINTKVNKYGRLSPPPSSSAIKQFSRKDNKQSENSDFGPFSIMPTTALVSAGSKQIITVDFHPENPGIYVEDIAIEIIDRVPESNMISEYRLTGESCLPGINIKDFNSIFEEHTVCKRLELFKVQNNVYAEEDRVFYFGALLTGLHSQARFKISNPYKIPCDVSLSLKPRIKSNKNDSIEFPFELEPKKINIPSYEYKFITVTFHPTSIQSYSGIFEAVVENVGDIKGRNLQFEIRGEGTLPRFIIERPTIKNKQGIYILKFKKLIIGASQTLPILLKNVGIIDAKVKLDWIENSEEEFICQDINSYITLKINETAYIEVKCCPKSIGTKFAKLRIKTIDNNFEDTFISLEGEGYLQDYVFENFPDDLSDEIQFKDCYINSINQLSFTVLNRSQDLIRAKWDDLEMFKFSPNTFHLSKNGRKNITVTFTSPKPINITDEIAKCVINKIKYSNPNQIVESDWDDHVTTVKWITSADPFSIKGQSFKKVLEKLPEPPHEIIPNTEFNYELKLSANADYVSYECEIDSIKFKNTMMYQTRAYKFLLKNVGTIKMDYSFVFIDENLGEILTENNEDFPFSVDPESGSIEANDSALITVRFTPNDVYDYQCALFCNIQNLINDEKPLLINVSGSSLRPFCHFELDECEYITNDHHHPDLVNSNGEAIIFDPLTKVLSFNSCGVKIRNSKRFYIVNTTQISYDFEWTCIAGNDKIFKCLTKKGRILSGKKFEINFEYTPENTDQRESLWVFRIKDSEISVPFLLVGQAMEPNIYMDRASINFNSILVGHQRKETINLVNSENTSFSFAFTESNHNKELISTLKYSPSSGTIQPHSEVPIEVIFSPLEEKLYNISLICNVKKKPTPVKVNIRGEGYEIHEKLISEINESNSITLTADDKADNVIDFGRVYINEKHVKKITIKNTGKFNIEYSWKAISSKYSNILTIVPEVGTVVKGEKVVCEIIFSPNTNIKLKNVKAACSIINGKTYNLKICGIGCCPLLSIDKPSYDFGVNYINQQNSKSLYTTFQIVNKDSREISFEIIPPTDPAFEVTNDMTCLLPNEQSTLTVYFNPTEVREYKDQINIEINGYVSQSIYLAGEGSEVRIELVNSDFQKISFGAVNMNSSNSKIVKIRNRGVIPATFTIGPQSALESLISKYVTINYDNTQITSNQNVISMKPKDIISIEVNFQPKQRVLAFDEDIILESNSFKKKLFSVCGVCQGIDVKLENSILSFGPVVQHSSTIRKLNIQNVGDIGTRFSWDTSKFYPDFTINPSEGYISPGIDIPIEIIFHPLNVQSEIRYENLICNIEHYHPLKLTLVGSCIVQPVQSEILKFSCPVRQIDTKSIIIQNKTATTWNISPIIENNSWSGQDVFEVEPGQSKSYDVTFKPLEMNGSGDGGRHEGSIFFPLPDGSGLLYKLNGIAEKPVSSGVISRDVPCKTNYTETLSISNWMKRSQRFKVSFELMKPDPAIIVKGKEYIDIPGLVERKYKVNFYSYKEGTANIKVIFKNETTQEYIFYNLNIRSTPAGVISTIELSTTARVSIYKEIVISNPLTTPASFVASCNSSDISYLHSFQIQPKTDYKLQIEYLPLIPKESTANLTLNSPELGIYLYDLKLSCSSASPERKLQFKVPLGLSQVQTFRFLSYTKTKTEYTCKIDSLDFSVDKSIIAPSAQNGGVEVCVDITYEPSKLGDIRSTLTVSSSIGGDYICPLFGHCVIPRPQGPILVKTGTASSVVFKNVFTSQATFNYSIDNPSFTIKAVDTIGPKKICNMLINFKQSNNSNQNTNQVSGSGNSQNSNSKSSNNNNNNSSNTNSGNNNSNNNNNNSNSNNNNSNISNNNSNNNNISSNSSNSRVTTPSKIGKLTITHQSGVSWVYYLKGMS